MRHPCGSVVNADGAAGSHRESTRRAGEGQSAKGCGRAGRLGCPDAAVIGGAANQSIGSGEEKHPIHLTDRVDVVGHSGIRSSPRLPSVIGHPDSASVGPDEPVLRIPEPGGVDLLSGAGRQARQASGGILNHPGGSSQRRIRDGPSTLVISAVEGDLHPAHEVRIDRIPDVGIGSEVVEEINPTPGDDTRSGARSVRGSSHHEAQAAGFHFHGGRSLIGPGRPSSTEHRIDGGIIPVREIEIEDLQAIVIEP